jgi:hypothetical protein
MNIQYSVKHIVYSVTHIEYSVMDIEYSVMYNEYAVPLKQIPFYGLPALLTMTRGVFAFSRNS